MSIEEERIMKYAYFLIDLINDQWAIWAKVESLENEITNSVDQRQVFIHFLMWYCLLPWPRRRRDKRLLVSIPKDTGNG